MRIYITGNILLISNDNRNCVLFGLWLSIEISECDSYQVWTNVNVTCWKFQRSGARLLCESLSTLVIYWHWELIFLIVFYFWKIKYYFLIRSNLNEFNGLLELGSCVRFWFKPNQFQVKINSWRKLLIVLGSSNVLGGSNKAKLWISCQCSIFGINNY